jgi:flavin-dependent dehydrogenase
MQSANALVAGGGLAGAAFALELARNGHRVVVLESTRHAHHKVCGEFLSAETQALTGYLGLDIAAMGATRASTLRLAAGKVTVQAPLPFEGAGFSRYRLDQALLEAAEAAGAEVVRGATVSRIDAGKGRVTVRARGSAFEGTVAALATGKHNVREFPRKAGSMVGFKIQIEVGPQALRPLEDVVQLVMFPGGYIGACIVENGLVTMCWVMERDLVGRVGASWTAQSAFFARQAEILGDLLADARPAWEKPVAVAGIPYGYRRRQPIASNVFPLGDQLAVIPSFTGDGMAIALYSGIAAAHAVLAGQSAHAFQTALLERLSSQFRWAGMTNLLFEKRLLQRPGVALAAYLPALVTWVAGRTRLKGFDDVMRGAKAPRKLTV